MSGSKQTLASILQTFNLEHLEEAYRAEIKEPEKLANDKAVFSSLKGIAKSSDKVWNDWKSARWGCFETLVLFAQIRECISRKNRKDENLKEVLKRLTGDLERAKGDPELNAGLKLTGDLLLLIENYEASRGKEIWYAVLYELLAMENRWKSLQFDQVKMQEIQRLRKQQMGQIQKLIEQLPEDRKEKLTQKISKADFKYPVKPGPDSRTEDEPGDTSLVQDDSYLKWIGIACAVLGAVLLAVFLFIGIVKFLEGPSGDRDDRRAAEQEMQEMQENYPDTQTEEEDVPEYSEDDQNNEAAEQEENDAEKGGKEKKSRKSGTEQSIVYPKEEGN